MRMLLKRAQGNGHDEGENEKWEQTKTGQKGRIADEVIDRARVQVLVFFFYHFFFLPFPVPVIPFPVSLFKVRATTCNRLCKRTQNVTSSHPTMLCAFARGLRACLHGVV